MEAASALKCLLSGLGLPLDVNLTEKVKYCTGIHFLGVKHTPMLYGNAMENEIQ